MGHADECEAIRRVLAENCFQLDTGDIEGACSHYAEDIVISGLVGEYKGHAGARALMESRGASLLLGRHLTVNSVIDIDGDTARVNSYVVVLLMGETVTVRFAGTYADRLVKQGGRWLLKTRQLLPGPMEALAAP